MSGHWTRLSGMAKVLIAGCSFSAHGWFNKKHTTAEERFCWSEELAKRYDVTNLAEAGSSNWDIWKSLQRRTWDALLVNLSGLGRMTRVKHRAPQLMDRDGLVRDTRREEVERVNWKCGRRITQLPQSYCWAWFPEYDQMPGVDRLNLPNDFIIQEDAVYKEEIRYKETGNHLTREGNEWMIAHMIKQIETLLGEDDV